MKEAKNKSSQNPLEVGGKTLLLIRHAKSSWDAADLNDFDRPLNERGKKDAPEMAKRLKEKQITIDLFVSSPAKRAKKTARYFAEEYDLKKEDILLVDDLYLASAPAFEKTVSELSDKKNTVAIFSHNPGITEFANSLTNVRIDDMPTCSIFALHVATDKWSDFVQAEKNFLFFEYPKKPVL